MSEVAVSTFPPHLKAKIGALICAVGTLGPEEVCGFGDDPDLRDHIFTRKKEHNSCMLVAADVIDGMTIRVFKVPYV
ncbi:MAG: hypothetical protein K9M10_03885 [Candidatus Pacebacteria bacterium]|nr:hypothetical protein [Candidatus Paceibacterota bacterium]MCF7857590.1 hypothetical protein [Candidatus Paceibacterota bacterium]